MSGKKGQVQRSGRVNGRHDGFTPKKRRRFLGVLRKTGCIRDAARVAGISTSTVDRWRGRDVRFAKACERALEMAAVDLEALAYDRAVHGVEEQVIRGGEVVSVKKKPSDGIFRMVLQASNPKKYGRMGAVGKEAERALRKKIEKEVRAEIEERMGLHEPIEAVRERIMKKLAIVRRRLEAGDQ